MIANRWYLAAVIGSSLACAPPLPGQAEPVPAAAALASSQWTVRMKAFAAMNAERSPWRRPDQRQWLGELLARENAVVVASLRRTDSLRGVSNEFGEEYSLYYAQVLETCEQYCDHTPSVVVALANGAYSPSSPFAKRLLTRHGPALVSVMIRRIEGGIPERQHGAVAMLGRLIAVDRMLAPAALDSAQRGLLRAATDSSVLVRQIAIRTIGDVGTITTIPAITRAESDPDPSVRSFARAARARLVARGIASP